MSQNTHTNSVSRSFSTFNEEPFGNGTEHKTGMHHILKQLRLKTCAQKDNYTYIAVAKTIAITAPHTQQLGKRLLQREIITATKQQHK